MKNAFKQKNPYIRNSNISFTPNNFQYKPFPTPRNKL